MKKQTVFVVVVFVFILAACSSPPPTPDPSLLSMQTEIAQLKDQNAKLAGVETQYVLLQSSTPVLKIVEVTPTLTPTPLYTPTITPTPTNTVPPTATQDPLKTPKGDGFYLIGVDIAPGIWRSNGTGDGCYWAVTTATGNFVDNHFGMSGGTAYISPSGFQVEFDDCGTWTFLQDP